MASTFVVQMLLLALLLVIFGTGIDSTLLIEKVEAQRLHTEAATLDQNQLRNTSHAQNKRYDGSLVVERIYMDGQTWNGSQSNNQPDYGIINHWATLQTRIGQYYGALGNLNVYGLPTVGPDQASATLVWVVNGLGTNKFNAIKAGWHVHPKLYGDHETHFFVHWMATDANGENIGCYNLDCSGFVRNPSSEYFPGGVLRPLSVYNGEQRFVTIKITKDQPTGDWWLHVGKNAEETVGYWPKSLFTTLADSASFIQWGGVAAFHIDQTSPPMGSGHFPSDGPGRAAAMLDIKLVSKAGRLYDPDYLLLEDRQECYRIDDKRLVLYGGPGGCTY